MMERTQSSCLVGAVLGFASEKTLKEREEEKEEGGRKKDGEKCNRRKSHL